MERLGIDFDNTLVRYEELFHKIATEQGLIEEDFPKNKKEIRNELNNRGLSDKFTEIQGEVYGLRINEARPAEGVINALKKIMDYQIPIFIVSHKTRYPYKGTPYNLHESAWSWLKSSGFLSKKNLGIEINNIYFEETKESKIRRIHQLKCTHYIDDLPEILTALDDSITKIHYNPEDGVCKEDHINMKNWDMLEQILKDSR